MHRLDGKNIVLTGGGSGLGRELALTLARKGCRIGVCDINVEGAEETLDMVKSAGGSGEVLRVDVSRPEQVEAMAGHFFSEWGRVDLLINNAGVVSVGFVGEIKLEDWQWLFGVNFWGMLHGCHSFIPRMKTQGGGHILNVASAAGLLCMMEMGPYNTAKAAIISLSETLRWELAPDKIGVTVLCPMFFNTHLLDNMRYTDQFECDFAHSTFEHARMTADQVAAKAIKAVEKRRLYCVPQGTGKFFWGVKRISPSFFSGLMSFINRTPVARPIYMLLARLGLL